MYKKSLQILETKYTCMYSSMPDHNVLLVESHIAVLEFALVLFFTSMSQLKTR